VVLWGRLVIIAFVAVLLLLAGCDVSSTDPGMKALLEADGQAKAICDAANAGTVLATAVPAGFAVNELRAAHMSTHPWDGMPSTKIIDLCYPTWYLGPGSYVDAVGDKTPAPPLSNGEKCERAGPNVQCAATGFGVRI
jgi:hypothetical protein